MAEQLKILFISAPIGSGHIRAAQSIQQSLKDIRPDIVTQLVNVFDFFQPSLGKSILNIYLKVLKLYPQAYGTAYSWGNNSRLALWGRKLISAYLASRMQDFITQYKPAAIVCTHATPAGLVSHLISKGTLKTPAIGVVTDFTVHRLWIYPEIDCYYVASDAMRHFLAANGIPLNRSRVSGIPIMSQFNNTVDKAALLQQLGLQPHAKTVLIMGGGGGLMPLDAIIAACAELVNPVQFIIVAGHNQTMYQKVEKIKHTINKPILLYGFTDNVHELMQAADLLISKPGGVSSAEALAAGLPIIIYKPIPGVEEANTAYLVDSGAALRANTLEDVKGLVQKLLHDDNYLHMIGHQAAALGKPNAAGDIAAEIVHMLDNSERV